MPTSVSPVRLAENMGAGRVVLSPTQLGLIDGLNVHHRLIKGQVFLWEQAEGWWNLWDEPEGALQCA